MSIKPNNDEAVKIAIGTVKFIFYQFVLLILLARLLSISDWFVAVPFLGAFVAMVIGILSVPYVLWLVNTDDNTAHNNREVEEAMDIAQAEIELWLLRLFKLHPDAESVIWDEDEVVLVIGSGEEMIAQEFRQGTPTHTAMIMLNKCLLATKTKAKTFKSLNSSKKQ